MTKVAPVFRETFQVFSKETLQWFPGHMFKGIQVMQRTMKQVDCILEVHDCRVPFSGRNPQFSGKIIGGKPSILILNKSDLISKKQKDQISKKMNAYSINFLFTNAKDQQCSGMRKIIKRSEDLIAQSDRYHRAEDPKKRLLVIGIPNVGKSSLINGLRNQKLHRGRAAPVGPKAGITKAVQNEIKVCENPPMYMVDTPGILPPNIGNLETGMKLALCACLPDANVGILQIADFLLYWLNKTRNFRYVKMFGLEEPSDEILPILVKLATEENRFKKYKNIANNEMVNVPDVDYIAMKMVQCFRDGGLGKHVLEEEFIYEDL